MLLLSLFSQNSASAQTSKYPIDIVVTDARAALSELARQTATPLLYQNVDVGGRTVNQVQGLYSLNEALEVMLKGTGISGFINKIGVITISEEGGISSQSGNESGVNAEAELAVSEPDQQNPVSAETTEQQSLGTENFLEEVLVTGSRIRLNSGMSTPTPVTILDFDTLNQMEPGNLIESLTQLPQFFNNESPVTAGSTVSTPVGASSPNLRGLGVNRTLVLLDGRRVTPYNLFGTVDINTLPQALIERVEMVTGGASTSYGSDAVAGVVNFILDTDFDGFKGQVLGGTSSRHDGNNTEASLTFGSDFGERSHLLLSGDFFTAEEIKTNRFQGRDWYQGWGVVQLPAESAPRQIIAPHVVYNDTTCGGMISAPGSALDGLQFMEDGSVEPFLTSSLNGSVSQSVSAQYGGGSGCNPLLETDDAGTIMPKLQRQNIFTYLDYDISENLNVYGQLVLSNSETELRGDNGALRGPWALTIYRENAFLPQDVIEIMEREGRDSFKLNSFRTSKDVSRGRSEQSNDLVSYTLGFDSDIFSAGFFEGWNISGFWQYGKSENRIRHVNFSRTDRLPQAVDAVVNPQTGEVECYAARFYPERYGDCVPINLFGAGNASQAGIDYVLGPNRTTVSDSTQIFSEINGSGEIHQGWGAGAVSMALGASYRHEELEQRIAFLEEADPYALVKLSTPDNDASLGLRGIPPGFANDPEILKFASIEPVVEGTQSVSEVFGELNIPLLAGRSYVQYLGLNAAYRYADYAASGGVDSWKFGFDWQIIDELRLRSTFSRDVRAGTMSERFNTRGANCGGIRDPEFDDRIVDCSTTTGGNSLVNPEEADIVTAGIVFQPSNLRGFGLSLDWYDIKLKGSIGQLGPQRIVDNCHAGVLEICDLIVRNSEGEINRIYDVYLNINAERARGADLELSYSSPVSFLGGEQETLGLRLLTVFLKERSRTNVGSSRQILTGEIGADSFPEWKTAIQLSYRNGAVSTFLQGRYISGGVRDNSIQEGVDINDNSVGSVFYVDMTLKYRFANKDNWVLFSTVNNLTDRAPPVVANFSTVTGGPQQMPGSSMFDIIGRRITLGLSMQF